MGKCKCELWSSSRFLVLVLSLLATMETMASAKPGEEKVPGVSRPPPHARNPGDQLKHRESSESISDTPVRHRAFGDFVDLRVEQKGDLYQCNCSNFTQHTSPHQDLCQPITGNSSRSEVFVWYVPGDGDTWRHYDWNKVTTVGVLQGISTPVPQDLLCYAHAHQVRVVYVPSMGCWSDNCGWVANKTATTLLIEQLTAKVQAEKLDGINVDIEGLTRFQGQFTQFVQDLVSSVRQICSSCQFSIDLHYIPMPKESFTGYDWPALAKTLDYLIPMNYDMCDYGTRGGFADANSPLNTIERAMNSILTPTNDQHVPAEKIVMGFPWYAYYVRCDNASSDSSSSSSVQVSGTDQIKDPCYSHLPFSQAASQHSLADAILNKLPLSSTGRLWDDGAQSPYFDFHNHTVRYRVRYDDKISIAAKCQYAKSQSVHGVAFWTGNVDYGVPMSQDHAELESVMWQSVVWPTGKTDPEDTY